MLSDLNLYFKNTVYFIMILPVMVLCSCTCTREVHDMVRHYKVFIYYPEILHTIFDHLSEHTLESKHSICSDYPLEIPLI